MEFAKFRRSQGPKSKREGICKRLDLQKPQDLKFDHSKIGRVLIPAEVRSLAQKLPFEACFPAHLKHLLWNVRHSLSGNRGDLLELSLGLSLDFLMRFWGSAMYGALQSLGAQTLEVAPLPPQESALMLLRYAVLAWQSRTSSGFGSIVRLGFFEPGEVPAPRLHCRWLGVAGPWDPAGPNSARFRLEVLDQWLKASLPLFVNLPRSYQWEESGSITVQLRESNGNYLTLFPNLPLERYAPSWEFESVLQAEAAERLLDMPDPCELVPLPAGTLEHPLVDGWGRSGYGSSRRMVVKALDILLNHARRRSSGEREDGNTWYSRLTNVGEILNRADTSGFVEKYVSVARQEQQVLNSPDS